jgi:hypothetical protein
LGAVPVTITLEMRVGLSLVVTVMLPVRLEHTNVLSTSEMVKLTAFTTSSLVDVSAIADITGASLTAVTSILKAFEVEIAGTVSLAIIVIFEKVLLTLSRGVIVAIQLGYDPEKTILIIGMTSVFEVDALKYVAEQSSPNSKSSSTSDNVNDIVVAVSSLVGVLATNVAITGASLTAVTAKLNKDAAVNAPSVT